MAVTGILLKHCVNVRLQHGGKSKLAAATGFSVGGI